MTSTGGYSRKVTLEADLWVLLGTTTPSDTTTNTRKRTLNGESRPKLKLKFKHNVQLLNSNSNYTTNIKQKGYLRSRPVGSIAYYNTIRHHHKHKEENKER